MTVRVDPGSKEYVALPVSSGTDLEQATVEMAFTTTTQKPQEDAWHLAEWDPVGIVTRKIDEVWQQALVARILVGLTNSGAVVELDAGTYYVWARISLAPQVIIKLSDEQLEMAA